MTRTLFRLSILLLFTSMTLTLSADQTLPIRLIDSETCIAAGGRIWPSAEFDQSAAGTNIVAEAENATRTSLMVGKDMGRDPEASGGAFIHFAGRTQFVFHVVGPSGPYTLWYRINAPFAGSWNHTEDMDGGSPVGWIDSNMGPTKQWLWIKGPTYTLTPGRHVHTFQNWNGGIALDKVIYSPDPSFKPDGIGPVDSTVRLTSPLVARSPQFQIPGLKSYRQLKLESPKNVEVELTTDGNHWKPLPSEGDLSSVSIKGGGKDSVQFRFVFRPVRGQEIPWVRNAELIYDADEGQTRTFDLTNGLVYLSVDTRKGIVAFTSQKPEMNCIPQQMAGPPFELVCGYGLEGRMTTLSGEKSNLVSATQINEGGPGVLLKYIMQELPILVTCRVSLPMDQCEAVLSLEVDNHTEMDILEVRFPFIRGVKLTKDPNEETLLTTKRLFPKPALGSVITAKYGMESSNMSWIDLFCATKGLYLGRHDPGMRDCDFTAKPRDKDSMDLSITQYTRVRPGKKWSSAPIILAPHEGDWHRGADRYRAWALTWMKRPALPPWIDEFHGWVPSGGDLWPTMVDSLRRGQKNGLHFVQVWDNSSKTSAGAYEGFSHPNPNLGRVETLKQAIRDIHLLGGYITFYINSWLWGVSNVTPTSIHQFLRTDFPKDVWIPEARFYEQARLSSYGGSSNGPEFVCPAASNTEKYEPYWAVDRYCKTYGADGIYWDQLGAIGPYHCVDPDHGHKDFGVETSGSTRVMSEILQEGRKANPNFIMSMEGSSDAIGQAVALHMVSGLHVYHDIEILRYTLPWAIVLEGYSNGGRGAEYKEPDASRNFAFLNGSRFEGIGGDGGGGELVALRAKVSQLLYPARFMDTVGVTVSDPTVRTRRFLLNNDQTRAVVLTFWNDKRVSNVTVGVDTSEIGAVQSAWAFTVEGEQIKIEGRAESNQYNFIMPPSRFSEVVLVNQCEPLVDAPESSDASWIYTAGGGNDTERFGDCPSGKLIADLPQGWATTAVPFGPISPGTTAKVSVPITVPDKAECRAYNLKIRAEGTGYKVSKWLGVCVLDPIEVALISVKPLTYQVKLTNRLAKPFSGTCSLTGYRPLSIQKPTQSFSLPANGDITLDFAATSAEPFKRMWSVDAKVTCGNLKLQRYLDIRPLLMDGGFEMNRNNDDIPDWWDYSYNIAAIHVEKNDPAEGKLCLRFDPTPGFNCVFQPFRIQPNMRYRITAQMKRETAQTNAAINAHLYTGHGEFANMMKPIGSLDNVGKWQKFEVEIKVPPIWYALEYFFTTISVQAQGKLGLMIFKSRN